MSLASNIRNARAAKKLTQQQLADAAAVNVRYIRKLESGNYEPDIALARIATVLKTSVEKLLTKP